MKNKLLRRGLIAICALLLLGLDFGVGVFVGRASTGTLGRGLFSGGRGFFFNGAHGAVGTIQQIDSQTITVQSRDGTTQVISVDSQTRIERAFTRTKISFEDLKVGDQVMAIGSPNAQGQINAKIVGTIDPSNHPPWWNIPPFGRSK